MSAVKQTGVKRKGHPGRGRGRAAFRPKGRQVETYALAEIKGLLGDRPRNRDLLIEYLHLVQDEFKCLAPAHMAALAEEMRIPMSEIYETATFYAHFDVLAEGESPPPEVTVRVCDSPVIHQGALALQAPVLTGLVDFLLFPHP